MKTLAFVILLVPGTAFAAVRHTKAQAAYLEEREKCVTALHAAKKNAKTAPADQRPKLLDAAKQAYQQCEDHAHLVWKYYPQPPPEAPSSH
jgi:hypothetical protein